MTMPEPNMTCDLCKQPWGKSGLVKIGNNWGWEYRATCPADCHDPEKWKALETLLLRINTLSIRLSELTQEQSGWAEQLGLADQRIADLEADREALRQIDALHHLCDDGVCCSACGVSWPCPTNEIIDATRKDKPSE